CVRTESSKHAKLTDVQDGYDQSDTSARNLVGPPKNLHYLLSIFQAVPKSHWAYSYPSNMCADTPRITAVMAVDGYRDFPAIARLPVICTFGNPPDLKTRSDDEVCSAAAYFDKSKGRCVCTEGDMVQINPSAYPNTPLEIYYVYNDSE
ncbi:hypothetical protein COOONC_09826, partial [Cooperia oncophora]